MEGLQTTMQEVLQRLETLTHPQLMHQEHQEFVRDWGQRGICGARINRVGQNHQERRFEVQERTRPVQDYQKPHKKTKITTKNLKIGALLMMNCKKRQ